ncbi:hypothetical protein C8J57DRAFT_1387191 [Mycena rebaudengoi]|nr:hypothetical protein C8J57DRAFT_1387191 [Mycena rebaudengoi]
MRVAPRGRCLVRQTSRRVLESGVVCAIYPSEDWMQRINDCVLPHARFIRVLRPRPAASSQTRIYRSSGTSSSPQSRTSPSLVTFVPDFRANAAPYDWKASTSSGAAFTTRARPPCTPAALAHLTILTVYAPADLGDPRARTGCALRARCMYVTDRILRIRAGHALLLLVGGTAQTRARCRRSRKAGSDFKLITRPCV